MVQPFEGLIKQAFFLLVLLMCLPQWGIHILKRIHNIQKNEIINSVIE